MKSLLLLAFIFFSHGSGAQVHSIVQGENGEPHMVKLLSGEVEFVEQHEAEKLREFESKIVTTPEVQNKFLLEEEPAYQPSLLSGEDIQTVFKNMNPFMRRKSECSDRAHVWAYDEFTRAGTKSEKAFLFLTDTYIKRHRYKWWFHVAPLYTTTSGEKIVMDAQFLNRPVTFTEWKNHLVFSKRDCVTDFRFLDYNAGADQTQDCYVKFEPMYYRIPGDIGNRENGTHRSTWNQSEVNSSRSRAFFKGSL